MKRCGGVCLVFTTSWSGPWHFILIPIQCKNYYLCWCKLPYAAMAPASLWCMWYQLYIVYNSWRNVLYTTTPLLCSIRLVFISVCTAIKTAISPFAKNQHVHILYKIILFLVYYINIRMNKTAWNIWLRFIYKNSFINRKRRCYGKIPLPIVQLSKLLNLSSNRNVVLVLKN